MGSNRHEFTLAVKGYLFTAVRNQALNYIKKEQRALDSLDDPPPPLASKEYHPEESFFIKN